MALYLPGIKLPHRKNTLKKPTVRINAPQTVTIPMSMHIGRPAIPTIKVGDTVYVGTRLGEADGKISSDIHSSVSGKVIKLSEHLMYNGSATLAAVIESDGNMTYDSRLTPPEIHGTKDLIAAIKNGGIVGLGGAGFPTHVKFDVDAQRIEYLIINGAECEPYVTSDTVTMLTRSGDMSYALRAFNRYFGINRVIIGIEKNEIGARTHKNTYSEMKRMAEEITDFSVEIKCLPTLYPQGGERVLVYHTTGRRVPTGKLPIDVGCIVINCSTLAAIGTYLKTGIPLVEKCVTVDGGAVKKPQNLIVPIGTSFKDIFDHCGGLSEPPVKLIYGGPMMGITVPDITAPVLKNTNAVLALTEKEAKLPKTTACIRCGACVNACPFGLTPFAISKAYDDNSVRELIALSVNACMECGCCSFVCPANRPLVQKNKLSKQLLKEEITKENNML